MSRIASPPMRPSTNGAAPKLGRVTPGATVPRMVINAVEGWGKTTLAAYAPKPAVLMARGETGYETLRRAGRVPDADCVTLENWPAVLAMVQQFIDTDTGHQTIVLDALGGFERLCHEAVCARDFSNDWGDKGFGSFQKGYDVAVSDWLQLLQRLDRVHAVRGCNIVILSHCRVKNFKNPLGPDFDRYIADCHDKTWSVTHKWADAVLFGQFVTVTQEDRKTKRIKGIGGTERMLYTQRTDGYDAKNRYGMPAMVAMPDDPAQTWATLWDSISGTTTNTGTDDVPPL